MNETHCKKCGTKWADKDEILDKTKEEHKKIVGHYPELV